MSLPALKLDTSDGSGSALSMVDRLKARLVQQGHAEPEPATADAGMPNGGRKLYRSNTNEAPSRPARKRPAQRNATERRKAEKDVRSKVDGRQLRATGRTSQLNFKVNPTIKAQAQKAAINAGIPLVVWMEQAIQRALLSEGVQLDSETNGGGNVPEST